MKIIYRNFDTKIENDAEKRTIYGRAITYGDLSKPIRESARGDVYKEVISRGAFTESLKNNPDVMAFKEHDPKMILGRVSAGTLNLREAEDGLYVEINVPKTSYGDDLLESVNRGDIRGFSFGFKPKKSKTYRRGDERIVERVEIELVEVSPVARPAYNETEMNVRNDDEEWENEDEQRSSEQEASNDDASNDVSEKENTNAVEAYKQKLRWSQFIMNNADVVYKNI